MWGGTDERESIRTIHAALDIGINLIDTAPVYGFGVSEEIVGKAIEARGHCEKVFIATEVGVGERVMRLKSRDRRRTQRPHLDWDLTNFEPTTRLSSCRNAFGSVRFTLGPEDIQRAIREVLMQFMRLTTDPASADVISGILNGVCPECGGRMGGAGREFKCQGECQRDWRQVWERTLLAGLDWRSKQGDTPPVMG